ncbi:MAG TPA: hypothetical protein VHF69_12315, partial [Candidatus Synoicihabitans sp.]|nr:hypothetical protein [Candidatus Synoicihabitans sp.]
YTVSVEQLPTGGSEDFSWETLSGVTVTKPPPSPRPRNPPLSAAATRTARASTAASAASVSAAAGVRATTAASAATLEGAVVGVLAIAPLWEGDINLPPAVAGARRRFVIRENEVYFKATLAPGDFIPVARRLVYADIVELPVPGD